MWFRVIKCEEVLLRSTIVWCVKAMRTISPPALITHQSNALTIISLVDTPHLIHNTHIRLESGDRTLVLMGKIYLLEFVVKKFDNPCLSKTKHMLGPL